VTARGAHTAPEARAPRVLWLIPGALALHNLEEGITFPRYLPLVRERLPGAARPIAARLDGDRLVVALVLVTVLALLVTVWAVLRPRSLAARWSALAVQAVVALNVASHVVVSIVLLRGYGPGLVTALAVNAPLSVHLFRRARSEHWIAPWSWWLLLPTAFVIHGPGLLALLSLG
jgi:hypothetical protein